MRNGAGWRTIGRKKRSTGLLAGLAALTVLALSAPAANALVVRLSNGHTVGVYLRPGLSAAAYERQTGARPATSARPTVTGAAASPNGLFYQGGPVLHTTRPYLVFWDPSSNISAASRQVMTQYYTDAAQDSQHPADVYAYRVLSQYTDSSGSAAQGQTFSAGTQAISDGQTYPPTDTSTCTSTNQSGFVKCITDAQIQAELTRLIIAKTLPTGIGANAPIYFVVTPMNVDVCTDAVDCSGGPNGNFCAYHSSYTGPGPSTVIYSSIPFTSGTGCQSAGPVNPPTQEPNADVADVITDNMSHENAEAITDPVPNTGWVTSNAEEVGDQCEAWGPTPDPNDPAGPSSPNAYMPELGGSQASGTLYDQLINGDHYFTQTLWSNSTNNCEATATISPSFAAPSSVLPGASATFDPSASTSTDGYASTTWSWGDGSPNTLAAGAPTATSHTFSAPGSYTVTLTLVDAGGRSAPASHTVVVDSAPTAAFSASPSLQQTGSPVAFNGSGSSDRNAGQSVTGYRWNFGDGSPTGTGATPSHTYSSPGTYTVTLTVTGSEGLTGSVSHTLTVVPAVNAVATFSPAHPVTGAPVSFNGGASTGGISSYTWNFGDGATGSGASPKHTYARKGTYTATLTVADAEGFTASKSVTVVVAKNPITHVSTKQVNGVYYLILTVNQAGTVKVGSAKVTLKHPGKATFKLTLTAAQLRKLAQHKTVTLNKNITFTPKHGPPVTQTKTVKV